MPAKLEFLDRDICLENMVLARDVLAHHGVVPFLHYGTLLGAMRERDFIPHDDDVDMGLFGRDKEAFLRAFPDLEAAGFTVGYIRDDGYAKTSSVADESRNYRMYKLKRKGQEIDFFFAFERRYALIRRWDIDGRVTVPARFLDSLAEEDFLGQRFSVPRDPTGFLRNLYGKTWNVPIRNTTSRIGWLTRLRKVTSVGKLAFYARRYLGERLRKRKLLGESRGRGREE